MPLTLKPIGKTLIAVPLEKPYDGPLALPGVVKEPTPNAEALVKFVAATEREFQPGDTVVYNRLAANHFKYQNVEYTVIPVSQIFGKI
jgi:hypothetical protein